ncbi:MAG: 4a-hydroxytetrahydrobiopterin dehydratase [Acidobacteriota bacterium]
MKLNEEQINERLPQISGWSRDGDWLTRNFKFENFKSAMAFVNQVADAAETMDHHPDILIHGWNNVRLSVMTHSQSALTEKDFELAALVNQLG